MENPLQDVYDLINKTPGRNAAGGFIWCGRRDLNSHSFETDPKSVASADSATPADVFYYTLFALFVKGFIAADLTAAMFGVIIRLTFYTVKGVFCI